ncbi:hypothetical protein ABH922_000922 [Rhodococcus sp. 27YEA15]|uniref:SRPBCC family protein n=1 Tax=Rhodococcus sp. 27YEA15 TaxID=3156259 RepID=UPI003C7A2EE4
MSSEGPARFLVERAVSVTAEPASVFTLIDDFRHWIRWSPWEGLDPGMQRTYSGADSGVGASYAWSGNKKAGSGSMTITESIPNERVVLDLEFVKPFKSRNVTTFLLTPREDGLQVTWQMTGPKNLFFRIFGFAFSMDKLIGKDFDSGLAQLKATAEKS